MTMRGAHYTCPNDTVMTNKWHSATAVTNLCPTITYLAPAAITNYISQTRRPGVRKPGSLSPKKGCFLFHNSDFCSRKLTLTDFSRLFSALVRRRHGRMPTFFHLWPDFHLSYFFPVWVGREREIDLFDIFWGRCTPPCWDIALPAIVNVHFNFGSGHTIFLFGWFCTNTTRAHIAICIFQRHISLLFKFPVCYFQISLN